MNRRYFFQSALAATAMLGQRANIVARTGRNLKFDAKTETILGDAETGRYLQRQYRKHWATPVRLS